LSDTALGVVKPYRKIVLSGNVVEVYEMENTPYNVRTEKLVSDVEWIWDMQMGEYRRAEEEKAIAAENFAKLDKSTQEWWLERCKSSEIGKLQKNIMRTRNMVRRLILSNFDSTAKFWTFTFDDEKVPPEISRSIEGSNRLWETFIKRMRRKYPDFKYLAVLEFQKRGAVHYHCLCDLPFVKQRVVQEIWGNGFVSVNRIKHVDNLGAYVVKYMTKELTDERFFGSKLYQCSKGLNRPVEYRGEMADRMVAALDLGQKKEVFTNCYESEYLGQITYKEYNLMRQK
jgi:hypothetical protein